MRTQPVPILRDDERAWFTWDDPMSVGEIRLALRTWDPVERRRLLAKILREAKDTEVWSFTTPAEVAAELPYLQRMLGRRQSFWETVIREWQKRGLIDG